MILDRDVRILHVEPTVAADLVVARMNVDPRTGRFDIASNCPAARCRGARPRFTGTVTRQSRPRRRRARSGPARSSRRPTSRSSAGPRPSFAVTAWPDQVVGMAAKAALRNGQALRTDDLIKPQIVQRNEAVTIYYEVPGMC